jgi:hypothetical protein
MRSASAAGVLAVVAVAFAGCGGGKAAEHASKPKPAAKPALKFTAAERDTIRACYDYTSRNVSQMDPDAADLLSREQIQSIADSLTSTCYASRGFDIDAIRARSGMGPKAKVVEVYDPAHQ